MKRSILFIIFLFGSLYPNILATSTPEKDDPIMEELLAAMRQFSKIRDKDEMGHKNDSEKKTVEDVRVVSQTQDVSVNAEQCPNVISSITSPSPSLTATCTEITYGCTDKSHVLVFSQNDEMCLKKGKASRHCNAEVGFEPPTCKATCDVLEVENGSWEVLGKNSVLINGNTVIAGTLINYTCDFGFQMIHNEEGPATPLNCMDNGNFDKDPPSCRETNETVIVTGCGGNAENQQWTRVYGFSMTNTDEVCPPNWQKTERQGIVGCTSKINGGCSPIYIELGNTKFSHVCGKAVGYQIAFPDAFAVQETNSIDKLYVDGLSITFGFPKTHIWTYSVGASKGELFGGTGGNCPCDNGQPQPYFVGGHMYCDSGHRSSLITIQQAPGAIDASLYSDVYNHTLWTNLCGESKDSTCCGGEDKDRYPGVSPPWFRRDDLKDLFSPKGYSNARFDIRLCTHEVDMQEGALITEFELYIQT